VIVPFLRRLLAEDQSGATAIEIGFLAALIAVAIIGSLQVFSNKLNSTFDVATSNVEMAP
jgi:Flp pilus assembly pilin Flp